MKFNTLYIQIKNYLYIYQQDEDAQMEEIQ